MITCCRCREALKPLRHTVFECIEDAHTIDIVVRVNGKEFRFQGDFLKEARKALKDLEQKKSE